MAGTGASLPSSARRTSRVAAVRAGLHERVTRATDALLTHAQPSAAGDAALAGRPGPMRLPRPSRRQAGVVATVVVVALAVLTVTGGPMAELTEAFDRALGADWAWVAAGVGFEAASFVGYILLFFSSPAARRRRSASVRAQRSDSPARPPRGCCRPAGSAGSR